jgi:1-acyl-sn-glycerol-3-phosphate acyltransferase
MLRRAWQTIRQQTLAWTFTPLYLAMMAVALTVTLGQKKDTLGTALMRGWGRVMLAIMGVRLDIDPETQAELSTRRARVLTFNHTSTLDLMLGAAITPEGTITIVKREMLYIPFIGQCMLLLDIVMINRRDRQSATSKLRAVGERIRNGRHTVMIAPEGTRSPDGKLQKFKMGAFHLAVEAQVPIVPLVWHDCATLYPRGAWHSQPGVVRVRKLPEVSTAGLTGDDVHGLAERLHAAYAAVVP